MPTLLRYLPGDIDRDETTGPLDILREIDLLTGAGAFDPWIGRSLPN